MRFHTPGADFALAVPADVPLGDLLPAVVGHAGAELPEEGIEHGGWVLQRLGGEPLDEERTPESLDLRDGDRLYLRARREALPPIDFDDLVDGIATGMSERTDSWRPALTHRLALALALAVLAGALALLALPGPHPLRVPAAVVTGALLLVGAGAAARAVGDTPAGIALGVAAVPFLALAGALLPGGPAGPELTGARLLAGASAAAGAAVLALATVGCAAPLFSALLVVALAGGPAGLLALAGLSAAQQAAVSAVVVVGFGGFVPALSFRLSGLRMPALPRNAEELQEDIEPFPADRVLARGRVADRYLTAFHLAGGAVAAVAVTFLALGDGAAPLAMAGTFSLLLLLHARAVGGTPARLAVLLPGAHGAALLAGRLAAGQGLHGRLLMLAGLLALTTALLVVAWTLPGRRLLPYWGRIADVVHTVAAAALLPLALLVTGVFHGLRAVGG
ncbi:type VII secretion integral membrane protein EccD [Streptomyces sp. WAC06614]|nr:type VII secretion integral membrane protein EccD [Streptomyces sp. WAC06614]